MQHLPLRSFGMESLVVGHPWLYELKASLWIGRMTMGLSEVSFCDFAVHWRDYVFMLPLRLLLRKILMVEA